MRSLLVKMLYTEFKSTGVNRVPENLNGDEIVEFMDAGMEAVKLLDKEGWVNPNPIVIERDSAEPGTTIYKDGDVYGEDEEV